MSYKDIIQGQSSKNSLVSCAYQTEAPSKSLTETKSEKEKEGNNSSKSVAGLSLKETHSNRFINVSCLMVEGLIAAWSCETISMTAYPDGIKCWIMYYQEHYAAK